MLLHVSFETKYTVYSCIQMFPVFSTILWHIPYFMQYFRIFLAISKYLMFVFWTFAYIHYVFMTFCSASMLPLPCQPFRYEQPWGAGAGGEGLSDALCPRLPHLAPWTDAAMLEAGAWWEAHFWVPAVLPGGLLYFHRAAVPARRKPVTCSPDRCGAINRWTKTHIHWQAYCTACTCCHCICCSHTINGYTHSTHI